MAEEIPPEEAEPQGPPPPPPQPADIWEWLDKAHPHDIIAQSFGYPEYGKEYYERAFMVLKKKKWSPFQIFFFIYAGLSPVLWPPFFSRDAKLTDMLIVRRWLVMFGILGIITAIHWKIHHSMQFEFPLWLSLIQLFACIMLVHILLASVFASPWHEALARIDRNLMFPKKPKKNKPSKKGK